MDPLDGGSGPDGGRLPRTRGDGPHSGQLTPRCSPASPHTRGWTPTGSGRYRPARGLPRTRGGWTRVSRVSELLDVGFPTRGWTPYGARRHHPAAGLPRTRGDGPSGSQVASGVRFRLPRTRGDGPVHAEQIHAGNPASPHTRGWTRDPRRARRRQDGFPAHAGMDPSLRRSAFRRWRLPRTRGDGPRPNRRQGRGKAGFPAHAGMDPVHGVAADPMRRLPRTRGDGPNRTWFRGDGTWASPHTRGWTLVRSLQRGIEEGFPAHAGMDPSTAGRPSACSRLPRTRGDGPVTGRLAGAMKEASPHTRGWTRDGLYHGHQPAGFPAHAGMDPARARPLCLTPWLPRTRGDGPGARRETPPGTMASSHTRGWTPIDRGAHKPDRGFPSHAGMDLPPHPHQPTPCGLPCTRGDGPHTREGGCRGRDAQT